MSFRVWLKEYVKRSHQLDVLSRDVGMGRAARIKLNQQLSALAGEEQPKFISSQHQQIVCLYLFSIFFLA